MVVQLMYLTSSGLSGGGGGGALGIWAVNFVNMSLLIILTYPENSYLFSAESFFWSAMFFIFIYIR